MPQPNVSAGSLLLRYVRLTCLMRQGLPLSQSLASSGHSLPASLRCVIYKEAVHVHFPLAPSHHHLCSQVVHIGTSYKIQCPFTGWGFSLGRCIIVPATIGGCLVHQANHDYTIRWHLMQDYLVWYFNMTC